MERKVLKDLMERNVFSENLIKNTSKIIYLVSLDLGTQCLRENWAAGIFDVKLQRQKN